MRSQGARGIAIPQTVAMIFYNSIVKMRDSTPIQISGRPKYADPPTSGAISTSLPHFTVSVCPYTVAVSPELSGKVLLQLECILPCWYRVILPVQSRPKPAAVPPHETVR